MQWRILLPLLLLTLTAVAEMSYPGKAPGNIVVICREGGIIVSNQAIYGKWRSGPKGLKLERITDVAVGRTLEFTNELFEIELEDGAKLSATELLADHEPMVKKLAPEPLAANSAAHSAGDLVELPLHSADGRIKVLWLAIARDNSNYLRQEIQVGALSTDCRIRSIRWLNGPLANASAEGQVDGSPIIVGNFFLGCEDPHALNRADDLKARAGSMPILSCELRPNVLLHRDEQLTVSFVLGVAPEGQLRRGFLYYLERERAHPYRPFLHYNSWYDIAWEPFALSETNCLEAIRIFGERLTRQFGVHLDALVFDDGWDSPQTLWQFHAGFPNGFKPLAELAARYDTHLGVWLSPFGGYGEPRAQRLRFGAAQGFETNATGFSLAGPKYYTAFKQACVGMIRNYGVNHFKFDGIAAGMYANGGADYYRDTEAMRRLMLELRQEAPALYINLTTGSWPSPFWLRYADSVWRQGDDMGFAGKGSRQQKWLNYRDQQVYRNIVRKGPLFPLNSLMTQGVAYSRKGSAGEPSFGSAGFKDDVRAFFGSGTGLQELYIQPDKLTSADWSVLAEAAKWSRDNADVLVDTHWLGGDPSLDEVYGYAAWSSRKGIVMLRNPDERPRGFNLTLAKAFELPPGNTARYLLKSPWAEDSARPANAAEAHSPIAIELPPFAVIIYEATPQ